MKKAFCLILITFILIFALSVIVYAESAEPFRNPSSTLLRAGGGGSGGGGGGGSGSSHHSGTGRPPTLFESIVDAIITPILLFSSSIIFYIKLTKRSRKAKKLMKQMSQRIKI